MDSLLEASNLLKIFTSKIFVKAPWTTPHLVSQLLLVAPSWLNPMISKLWMWKCGNVLLHCMGSWSCAGCICCCRTSNATDVPTLSQANNSEETYLQKICPFQRLESIALLIFISTPPTDLSSSTASTAHDLLVVNKFATWDTSANAVLTTFSRLMIPGLSMSTYSPLCKLQPHANMTEDGVEQGGWQGLLHLHCVGSWGWVGLGWCAVNNGNSEILVEVHW